MQSDLYQATFSVDYSSKGMQHRQAHRKHYIQSQMVSNMAWNDSRKYSSAKHTQCCVKILAEESLSLSAALT